MSVELSLRRQRARNTKFRAEINSLKRELADMKHALPTALKDGFRQGCRETTMQHHLAIAAFGTDGIQLLSDPVTAPIRKKSPPPSTEIDTAITRSVIESMRAYNPKRAAELDASFRNFLAGDSK